MACTVKWCLNYTRARYIQWVIFSDKDERLTILGVVLLASPLLPQQTPFHFVFDNGHSPRGLGFLKLHHCCAGKWFHLLDLWRWWHHWNSRKREKKMFLLTDASLQERWEACQDVLKLPQTGFHLQVLQAWLLQRSLETDSLLLNTLLICAFVHPSINSVCPSSDRA